MVLQRGGAAASAIRVVTGVTFLASGVLKIFGLQSGVVVDTLAWQATGRCDWVFVGLAAFEVLLGSMLVLRLAVRYAALMGATLCAAGTVWILVARKTDPRPCGCFGVADTTGVAAHHLMSIAHHVLLLAALVALVLVSDWGRPGRDGSDGQVTVRGSELPRK